MRVRLVLDVGDYERFVIARYWGVAASTPLDKARTRATRSQVKAFAAAALRAAVKEQAGAMRGRARATATRLSQPSGEAELVRPKEQQPELAW